MFENLNYGDTKKEVIRKLDESKRFDTPTKTIFGRTGTNGMFTAKTTVNGLAFTLYFGWDDKDGDLLLNAVDLYSAKAPRAELSKAYQDLYAIMTELFGRAKFNNGLPSANQLTGTGSSAAGAVWFYDGDAVTLGIGAIEDGHNLVINFMDEQPTLTRTN